MNDNDLKTTFSIIDLLNEMNLNLENEMYVSALIVALIIPDILGAFQCGNNSSVGCRYKKWCKENLELPHLKSIMKGKNVPNSEINKSADEYIEKIYQLRCSLLHENTTQTITKNGKPKKFSVIFLEGAEDNNSLAINEFCQKIEIATINYVRKNPKLLKKEQEWINVISFEFDDDSKLRILKKREKYCKEVGLNLEDIYEN